MTAEEKREWIRILFEKVLTIHEQGKHYASVEISNADGSTFVSVTAMEDGFAIGKSMISINIVLWILIQKNFR